MGMGVHEAVAVELEAMLMPVMGKDAKKGFEVLRRSEKGLLCVASEDDVIDGGRGCKPWWSWHTGERIQMPCQET
jgi:hypothetical protein